MLAPEAGVRVIDLIAVDAADAAAPGPGSALVERAARARATAASTSGTQVANTGALRFYERLGFVVTDDRATSCTCTS